MERIRRDALRQGSLGELGRFYHANHLMCEAAFCYRQAIDREPDNAQWPYLLAAVNQSMGSEEEIVPLLTRATNLAPRYAPALIKLGDTEFKDGNLKAASSAYEQALRIAPQHPYAHLGLARVATRRGEGGSAEEHLNSALAVDPRFGAAHRIMASLYEQRGDIEQANRARARAKNCPRFRPAPDPWIEELDEFCYDPDYLLVCADLAKQTEETNKGIAYLHRATEVAPENAKVHAIFGNALRQLQRTGEARDHFLQAIRLDPQNEAAHYGLGLILGMDNRLEEAEAEFHKALEINEKSENAYYGLGMVAMKRDELEQAASFFRKAGEFSEYRYDDALKASLQCLLRTGQKDNAISFLEEVLTYRPTHSELRIHLAALYVERSRWDEAARLLREGLDISPYDGFLANRLGWLLSTSPLATRETAREAIRLAELACDLVPDNYLPKAMQTLAAAHARNGDFENATAAIRRAIAYAEEDAATVENEEKYKKVKWVREFQENLALFNQNQPISSPL